MSNYKLSHNRNSVKMTTFDKVCTVQQGLQLNVENRFKTNVPNSYIYLTVQYLKNLSNPEYILNPRASVVCRKDEILVARTGSTGKIITNVEGVYHNNFFKLNINKNFSTKFIYFVLTSPSIQKRIQDLAGVTTIPDLNHSDFYMLNLLDTTLEQQTAIANILSAQESIVQDIESLITKYEKRFQYLSNELLSGRIRVREVHGNIEFYANTEWKEVEVNGEDVEIPVDWTNTQLKTFGKIKTSSVDKKIKKDEDLVNLLNFMDIYKSSSKIIDITIKFTQTSIKPHVLADNEIKKGDVFFTPSSETEDDIGLAAVAIEDIKNTVYSYHLIRFRPSSPNLNIEFSSKLLNSTNCRKYFTRICDGLTRKTLKVGDFEDLAVVYPESLKEQSNIYNVLRLSEDMISTEKDLLLKEKQKFQFLLDNLLSGKYLVEEA